MRILFAPSCNVDELRGAMGAGVTAADRLEAARGQRFGALRLREPGAEGRGHVTAVAREQKVAARAKKALGIVPRGGDQRDAARHRLERPDGGYARQRARIWAS